MRQKLGLCCCLIHDPDLLILDEPTTGVDPLSRRRFWELIDRMRARRKGMSVLVATAYMEEAERFDWLAAMNAGKVLATGTPADLKAQDRHRDRWRTPSSRCFRNSARRGHKALQIPPRRIIDADPVIVARDLTCRFGDFTAVDKVNFTIERGEIFGFLGSNGCGKTTTMKMLTGLLPPSEGEALLFGKPLDASRHEFALPRRLHVAVVLALHRTDGAAESRSSCPSVPSSGAESEGADRRAGGQVRARGLSRSADPRSAAGDSPAASLAVAIVHEPEILILDEPTSGVDPLARDRFWEALIDLSRKQGVTIFVSTHFMNEAARCDRISLMDSGRVLATGTPAELVKARGVATLEDAFISYLEEATGTRAPRAAPQPPGATGEIGAAAPPHPWFSLRRLLAYSIREALELLRDPIRLGFSLFGTALLMLVFGFGVSTDVNNLSFAVLDHDQSPESRAYLEELRGSSYFVEKAAARRLWRIENRMKSGDIKAAIEIPPGFGRDIKRGRPAWVGAWVDGAMPFRAETIRGYLQGMHELYLTDPAVKTTAPAALPPADIELRFKYNQDFDSIYAMVPANMSLLLGLFPAILMALAVVREKELGSITNLYVTPGHPHRISARQATPLCRRRHGEFRPDVPDGAVRLPGSAQGQLSASAAGRAALCHGDDGLWHVDFRVHEHPDRRAVRHSHPDVLPATQFSGMMTPVSSLAGARRSWVARSR